MPTGFRYQDEQGHAHDAFFRIDKGMVAALVGVTIALLTQTGSFLWWASSISTTVSDQGRRITDIEGWRGGTTVQREEIAGMKARLDDLAHRIYFLESVTHRIVPEEKQH